MTIRRNKLAYMLLGCCALLAADPACAASAPATSAGQAVRPVAQSVLATAKGPNVLIVLMDDVGFAADSTFGGPIPTPNLDAVARQGLRYNRFNTTAMCSPTRAALLTGRNHHRVEMGSIVNLAIGERGYTSIIPKSAATIGRVLQLNGYATAWFGKNHVTPLWEQTAAGPFDRWPTGFGFDYFYGFMDGASDQLAPTLVENTVAVEPPARDHYFLDRDLADHAISWIDRLRSAAPDKPFLAYLAPGTGHEPHQAPPECLARFRGKFDQGWDRIREETFARQKAMGIIPADARLSVRPDLIPAWDSLSADQKRLFARYMEAHAAQRSCFDDQFGRVVAELKRNGQWDNTLVLFIDGDNGASGEGGPNGTVLGLLNRPKETLAYDLSHIDDIGGPKSAGNYPAGWAIAMDTPFPWFKQIASFLGGQRAGLVVSWPGRLSEPGSVRHQYGHVNDIAATIYDAAGIKLPPLVDGVRQLPLDGTSLVYSFKAPNAPSRHRIQYYEMLGNRAIYKDGWLASRVPPRVMWKPGYGGPDHWELYNLDADFSQTRDVASQYPAKLKELKAELERQEVEGGFRLIDAPNSVRSDPAMRPSHFDRTADVALQRSDRPILDGAFPHIVNRHWSLTVPLEVTDAHASGTIISQGGYPVGWGLYVFDGKPTFLYRNEPEPFARIEAAHPMNPGKHVVRIEMRPLDGNAGGPALVALRVDDQATVEHRLPATVLADWGANGVGIGREVGRSPDDSVVRPFVFTGTLGELKLRLEP